MGLGGQGVSFALPPATYKGQFMTASATTEIDLANMALTMLGQQPINDLTDNNNRANLMNTRLADVRDSVLRAHNWNSAIKRAALATLSDTPTWGFDNAFALPSDFVRLAGLEDELTKYRIEAGNSGGANTLLLLSDATTVNILYVYQITDVSKMDHSLKQAIATRLASELALAITGDPAKENFLMQKYELLLGKAQFEDSQGHHSLEHIHAGEWLGERRGSGVYRDFPKLDSSGDPV